ncbi:hypothetical protein [Kiloniella antarctica]|uniref:Uncharacterized protein n=1 Tax=Kiloniella antarctica TaxID=1550907 RepID=A0ABW5BP51_9PROT
MSILFKEALTVSGILGLAILVWIGTLIMTARFNKVILRERKFWTLICGNRTGGPAIILGVVSAVLIINGYFTQSPWSLGAGLIFIILCYVKYRDILVKDPFERNEE